jgi:phosphate transport system protein
MQSVHIVSAYDEELKYLVRRIAAMGGHAERMVEQAVAALVHADPGLAAKVVRDDLVLDEGQREIDDKAIIVIARRQPMATDLREIIGTIRIAADLERIGDHATNIAETIYYIVTGDQMPAERPKGDKTDRVVLPPGQPER